MRAVTIRAYGGPEVLSVADVPLPPLGDRDVLVRVAAASVNAADWRIMRADPFVFRLYGGLLRPKFTVLGADLSGRIARVGSAVTAWSPGDDVIADLSDSGLGAFAESARVPEAVLAPKPRALSFQHAAALPLAGVAALQAVRDAAKVTSGQRVLVNGAAGGVGSFALQIAKAFGAEVTAVCGPRHLDLVRTLGADHVIDYTVADYTTHPAAWDAVVDTAARMPPWRVRRAVKSGGRYVFVGGAGRPMYQTMVLGAALSLTGPAVTMLAARSNGRDLRALVELVERGQVRPLVDAQRFGLAEVPQAIQYVERGHPTGKVVITVSEGPA